MKLYNTLSHDVQEFAPADGKTVKMYVCGVTPYSSTHVGHALSYVAFDTLRRYLEFLGFDVRHVQNFTDVDDKIINRAKEQGIEPDELAEEFIDDFYRTMDALNIQRAHVYPDAGGQRLGLPGGRRRFLPRYQEGRLRQAQPPDTGRDAGRR